MSAELVQALSRGKHTLIEVQQLRELTQALIDAHTLLADAAEKLKGFPDLYTEPRQTLILNTRRKFFPDVPMNQPLLS